MKNSADQGGCYPQRPKVAVDNALRDLQNSSYPTKAEFNNCFIIHSKYFLILKGVSPLRSLFFRSPNITQPCPQVFSVNGSIICSGLRFWRHFDVIGSIIFGGLPFWRHWFNMAKILCKFGEQQLAMVNYACGFNQSETGKYCEWIINFTIVLLVIMRNSLFSNVSPTTTTNNNLITHSSSLLAIAITSYKNQTNRDKISPCLVLPDERKLALQHSISKVNAEERALTATSFVQSMTWCKVRKQTKHS